MSGSRHVRRRVLAAGTAIAAILTFGGATTIATTSSADAIAAPGAAVSFSGGGTLQDRTFQQTTPPVTIAGVSYAIGVQLDVSANVSWSPGAQVDATLPAGAISQGATGQVSDTVDWTSPGTPTVTWAVSGGAGGLLDGLPASSPVTFGPVDYSVPADCGTGFALDVGGTCVASVDATLLKTKIIGFKVKVKVSLQTTFTVTPGGVTAVRTELIGGSPSDVDNSFALNGTPDGFAVPCSASGGDSLSYRLASLGASAQTSTKTTAGIKVKVAGLANTFSLSAGPDSGSLALTSPDSHTFDLGTVSALPDLGVSLPGSPYTATVGSDVTFTPSVTDACGTPTYTWDFDDSSSTSTAATPTHQYTAPGAYTGSLTVVDGRSQSKTVPFAVTVNKAKPSISLTVPAQVSIKQLFQVKATLSGAYQPTRNVVFKLYGPGDPSCAGTPVSVETQPMHKSGSVSSAKSAYYTAGVYYWSVLYKGDANNEPAEQLCAESTQINGPPTVTSDPSDVTAPVRGTATFTAVASGTPDPDPAKTVWEVSADGGKSWTALGSSSWADSGGSSDTSTLTLTGVTAGMNGREYRVTFANSEGATTSKSATLTVTEAPVIVTQPSGVSVLSGGVATFTSSAVSLPGPPGVRWQSCVSPADCGTPGGWTDIGGATGTTLTVSNVSSALQGARYRAVFTNAVGSTFSDPAMLTVTFPSVVVLPASLPAPAGSLSGVPVTTGPGQTFTVTGTGFGSEAPVTFGIYSSPRVLAHVTADTTGVATATVTVPAGLLGDHTVTAAGAAAAGGDLFLEAGTTVVAASSSSSAAPSGGTSSSGGHGVAGVSTSNAVPVGPAGQSVGPLADTGPRADPLALARIGLLALLAGAGLLVIARRRSPRRH